MSFVLQNKRVSLRHSEDLGECLGIEDKLMEEEMRHHKINWKELVDKITPESLPWKA
jgi:hypothetical protein